MVLQGRSRRVIRRRAVEPSLSCFKKGNKASRDDCYEEQNEPLYYTSIDTTSVKRTPEHKSKSEAKSEFAYPNCERRERSTQQNHPLKESCGLANSQNVRRHLLTNSTSNAVVKNEA
ncbi:hypothetical protein Tco_0929902, partial [Tanacetum coccineum]